MDAEVIAIGDELTSGQRLDTNSQWLSERLGDLGIRVRYHSTVGDDLQANVLVFQTAFARADTILCTGGLGPTADDLTRHALAEATGAKLVQDDEALQHIRDLFARRKREMPPANVVQALFPEGSRPIPNPHGSAPGIAIEISRLQQEPVRLFALPGVPAEMREMWHASVAPELLAAPGGRRSVIRHRRVKCFGVGESDLEQMLPDLVRRGRTPSVGITVSKATITLRVTSEGETEEACLAVMQPTLDTIHQCLGELVFGNEDDELQHAVVRVLGRRGRTLSVVEWCTAGLVSRWLSEADPGGSVFKGGIVVRDADCLTGLLQIPQSSIAQHGMHSPETVSELAVSCRGHFRSDYALAIGPTPTSDSPTEEPGQLHSAVFGPGGTTSQSFRYAGHPDILQARGAKQALNLLRLRLTDV